MMAASRALLKQSDLTRYAKAMRAAGVPEWRGEVFPSGKQVVIAGKPEPDTAGPDWDDLVK